ncbi:hypothetical protein BHE74_00056289 [Ensete ventricosum]|nr:hypothetical protein BHE74_00056289 [Ensete ventricosum]
MYADCQLSGSTVEIGVSLRGNDAMRHLPVWGRGTASSSSERSRRCLVSFCGNEMPPRSPAGRRGVVLARGEATPHLSEV